MADLEIKNLHVSAGDKQILKGVDLHVRSGEIHCGTKAVRHLNHLAWWKTAQTLR